MLDACTAGTDGIGSGGEAHPTNPRACRSRQGPFVFHTAPNRRSVAFCEFLTLVQQDATLQLKLKHFNADLTGWEDKERFVTFRLARVTSDTIYPAVAAQQPHERST
jgi:hypothetical protein